MFSNNVSAVGDDKVIILGSGTCIPSKTRQAAANYITMGGKRFMVDGGSGSLHALVRADIDYKSLDGIFYTHFHPDHIGDLAILLQAMITDPGLQERTTPFCIYGPLGSQVFVSEIVNTYDFHKYFDPLPFEIITEDLEDGRLLELGGCSVTVFRVPHTPASVGYRFTSGQGYVVVFSGDTGYGEEVINLARNADLAIFECSWTDEWCLEMDLKCHLGPKLAGELAKSAGVKKLVLTHIYPEVDKLPLRELCQEVFGGEVVVAQDGQVFTIEMTGDAA